MYSIIFPSAIKDPYPILHGKRFTPWVEVEVCSKILASYLWKERKEIIAKTMILRPRPAYITMPSGEPLRVSIKNDLL